MTQTIQTLWLLLVGLCATACATTFNGPAFIEGGRQGCERKCADQGLAMSALVYLGEYSNACVCSVPSASAAPDAQSQSEAARTAAAVAAATATAGVLNQLVHDSEARYAATSLK